MLHVPKKNIYMLRSLAIRAPPGCFCTICQQFVQTKKYVLQLPCKHCFHFGCYRPWQKVSHTCPVCRKPHFFQCYHLPYPFSGTCYNRRYYPSLFNAVLSEFRYIVRKCKGDVCRVSKGVLQRARRYMDRQDQRRYYCIRFDLRTKSYVRQSAF